MRNTRNQVGREDSTIIPLNESRNKFGLVEKDIVIIPDTFSELDAKLLKKYYSRIYGENDVQYCIRTELENHLPNKENKFNADCTYLSYFKIDKDYVYMNNKSSSNPSLKRKEIFINLKNSYCKVKRLIVEAKDVSLFPFELFKKSLLIRLEKELSRNNYFRIDLEGQLKRIRHGYKYMNIDRRRQKEITDEITALYESAIKEVRIKTKECPKKSFQKKTDLFNYNKHGLMISFSIDGEINVTYKNKTIKPPSPLLDREGCEQIYNEFGTEKYFDSTKEEFINALNLIGKPVEIEIIHARLFYYLIFKVSEKVSEKFIPPKMKAGFKVLENKYRETFFNKISQRSNAGRKIEIALHRKDKMIYASKTSPQLATAKKKVDDLVKKL